MKTALAIFALATLAMPVYADWNGPQSIQALYPQSDSKDVLIQQPGYFGSGCSGQYGKYLLLKGTHPNYSSLYALFLAAQMSDRVINIYLVNGSCTASGYSEVATAVLGTVN